MPIDDELIAPNILGHDTTIERLTGLIDRQSVPSSLLFCGPAGIGKFELAQTVALALLANEANTSDLRRKQVKLTHPDLLVIELSEDETLLKIDQVRSLQQFLGLTPFQADSKVVIIRQAEALTVEAQQALLKTLEEPPAFATLILIADTEEALLPTMLSRLSRFPFSLVEKTVVVTYLSSRGFDLDLIEQLWARFGGRMGALMTHLETHSAEDIHLHQEAWEKLLMASPADRLLWSSGQNFDSLPKSLATLSDLQSLWRTMGQRGRLDNVALATGQRLLLQAQSEAKPGLNYQLLMDNVLINLPQLKGSL